jgi:hypothetical protein
MLNVERLENLISYMCLGGIKPKGPNSVVKVGYGHLFLREENLSFNNNYIILGGL